MSPHGATMVAGAVAGAVVVAALVGGALKIGRASGAYWRDIDRSYAAQVGVAAVGSNRLGSELARLLPRMQGETRTRLQLALDTAVRTADAQAAAAATASQPSPYGSVGVEVATAFADRARAVADVRKAVDGLLQMGPLPVVGAPGTGGAAAGLPPVPPAMPPAAAATELATAGNLLERADAGYAAARRVLRVAPGHAALPESRWVVHPRTWQLAGAQAIVTALAGSAHLAPVQRLALLTQAVALTPSPVPPAPGAPAGTAVLPPTHRLSVTVVVADEGNVADRHVVVHAAARRDGSSGRTTSSHTATVAVAPGGSVALEVPALPVTPGGSYTVTLTLAAPAGEVADAATTFSFSVAVAPPSPPTVTGITPARGGRSGGAAVTIFGTGFTSVIAVDFGKRPARFRVVSATQITAIAPAGSGTVTVTVGNPGGTSAPSPAARFAYTRRAAAHA